MAVANGSRLIARLQNAIRVAETSPIALPDVALETIADVQANAAGRLAGQQYQVGFDLDQFQANIAAPGPLRVNAPGVGSIGILDFDKMGTVKDFEEIRGEGLFHQGTGDRAGVWQNVVYPDAEWRESVARDRQAVWGNKTPQWMFLEDGFTGNGAFPATPAHHFIADATGATTILPRLRAAFARIFKGL